jgi:hypothetical protein
MPPGIYDTSKLIAQIKDETALIEAGLATLKTTAAA